MATKSNAKTRSRTKPLLAKTAHVRREVNGAATPMLAFAELPVRLLNSRTPVEVWLAYLHFGHRLFSAMLPAAFATPPPAVAATPSRQDRKAAPARHRGRR